MSSNKPVNIICMKWGSKYGADYVNKLYGMVSRNISIPFRFICFTEIATDIREEVIIRDLPNLGLPENIPERGWLKLATFQSPLADLQGTTLFLDLDVIILGNLDDFFEYDAEFAICFDQKKKAQKIGNSSVYKFEAGAHSDVLEYFQENFDDIKNRYRNEQAYLSDKFNQKGLLKFWPKQWTPSFKYHCIPKFPSNFWKVPFIPKGSKVILFHGKPEPYEAEKGISKKWYRYFKPVKWVSEHWKV